MVSSEGIRIDVDGILRKADDGGEFFVEFVADRDTDRLAVIAAMYEAVEVAHREVPDTIGVDLTVTLAGGAVMIRRYAGDEGLTGWIATFARVLRERGYTGSVHVAPLLPAYDWLWTIPGRRPVAYVALDGGFGTGDAFDAATATRWCERAVRWAELAGVEPRLTASFISQAAPVPDLAVRMSLALRVTGTTAITYADQATSRATRVHLLANGQVLFQEYNPAATPAAVADRARAALLANADGTRLGFVAMTPKWAYGWGDRAGMPPYLPTIDRAAPWLLSDNAEVWSGFVPDAHGMQVLTDGHLRRVSDLSAWNVTAAGAGRHLVETRDPDAWFGPGEPDAALVAAARADFGPAIVPAGALGP